MEYLRSSSFKTFYTAYDPHIEKLLFICIMMLTSFVSAQDGAWDNSFNGTNAGCTGPGGLGSSVTAIAVQADGKILIGGFFLTYNLDTNTPDRLIRLNTDGSRDVSFNAGGSGVEGTNSSVNTIAIQSDGKILISVGLSYNGETAAPNGIIRLNTDGTRDITFNGTNAGANSGVNAICILASGKILVGGGFTEYNGEAAAPDYLIRLNSDGSRDMTFNGTNAGIEGGFSATVAAIVEQADGKILIGGVFQSYNGASVPRNIIRLEPDGSTLDPFFNDTLMSNKGTNGAISAIAVQADGKILLGGGFTSYNGNSDAPRDIMRLNIDGSADITFNWKNAGANNAVFDIDLQTDNKILIAGHFSEYNGDSDAPFGIMRLNSDGSPDMSFNWGNGGTDGGQMRAVTVLNNGKVLIGGGVESYNGDFTVPDGIIRLGNTNPNCPNILDVTQNPIPSGTYKATITVKSASSVMDTSNVSFQSGTNVQLFPNFLVPALSIFEAIIANCN